MMRASTRASMGGQAVISSLEALGFDPTSPRVSLAETAKPSRLPFERILAQNAWNVIPQNVFAELLVPYPKWMQAQMFARRVVALHNLRRARQVVCMTDAMASYCRGVGVRRVTVSP